MKNKPSSRNTKTKLLGITALTFVAIILAPLSLRAQGTYNTVYHGTAGVWEEDGAWSTGAYPNNGHYIVINGIPYPGVDPSYNVAINVPTPITLGRFVRVQTVNIAGGSTLHLPPNGFLWANRWLTDSGVITLNGTSSGQAVIRAGENMTVINGGVIFMGDSDRNVVTAANSGLEFTIDAGGRIRGAGSVNAYLGDNLRTFFQIVNHGLIEAMQPVHPLRVQLTDDPAFPNAMINDGTLRASGPGVLHISAPFGSQENVQNQGGAIEAIDNGTVRLQFGATITGGTLATSGSGTIRGDFPGSNGGTFKDVLNTGTMAVDDRENFGLAGTFTNNGLVRLDAPSSISNGLVMRGNSVTLTGTGLIAMNGGATIAGGDTAGQTAIIGPGLTIRGQGTISTNTSNFFFRPLNVVNQGLIDATGPLTILVATDANSNLTNNGGTLRASNGGLLQFNGYFSGGLVLNSGGTVEALNGSIVRVNDLATVEGGTITTSGTGTIRGGFPERGGMLKNVTSTGTVALGPQEWLHLAGTFTNNGLVRFEGTPAGAASLFLRDDVTLAGTGLFAMGGQGAVIAGKDVDGRIMTIAPGVTIRGDGTIGGFFGSKLLNIVNQGTIEATNGMNIFVWSQQNSNVANNGGVFRASPGATLQFNGSGTVSNNGGLMEALNGSTIKFINGATFINNANGTIDLDGGAIDAPAGVDLNGGSLIGNGTVTGPIRNNGGTVAPGFSAGKITINGNYTQGANGILNLEIGGKAPGTEYDQLRVNGTATLGGTLNVSLINGFRPAVGDIFQLIAPNAFAGSFAAINTVGFTAHFDFASNSITLTVTSVPHIPLNVSTRMEVGTDPDQLIGGFIITGTEAKKVVILATGPSLTAFQLTGVLADPILELYKGNQLIATNDNWKTKPDGSSQQAEIEATGFAPKEEFESALVRTLVPGDYTAVVRGTNGTGIGTVQLYDLAETTKSKLANISSRGRVEPGDSKALIAGFIMGGDGGGDSRVIVLARGPSLSGVASLPDPTMEVKNANGSTVTSNDDWEQSPDKAEISARGFAPSHPKESALMTTLPKGAFTAVVRGKGDAAGVAVVEVYHID